MPDPLSVAVSIIQVADTGFKLANTIYFYASQVHKAEKQLRPIADFVKLTATVLKQVASHLQDEDLKALYKPTLLTAANDALRNCEETFHRLDAHVRSLVGEPNSVSRAGIPLKTRLVWPWKQKELDAHQIHLERCKSTFDLLLGTLTFVSSSRAAKDTSTIKLELQQLMREETEAKAREAALSSQLELHAIDGSCALKTAVEQRSKEDLNAPTPGIAAQEPSWSASALVSETRSDLSRSIDELDGDYFLLLLNSCAVALNKLSGTLHNVRERWKRSATYDGSCLMHDFEQFEHTMAQLPRRQDSSSCLDTQDRAGSVVAPALEQAVEPQGPGTLCQVDMMENIRQATSINVESPYAVQSPGAKLASASASQDPKKHPRPLSPHIRVTTEVTHTASTDLWREQDVALLPSIGERHGHEDGHMAVTYMCQEAQPSSPRTSSPVVRTWSFYSPKPNEPSSSPSPWAQEQNLPSDVPYVHVLDHPPKRSHSDMSSGGGDNSNILAHSSAEEYSPTLRAPKRQRGDPPTNADNKYVCDFTAECATLTFDRRCEWSKHMDKHERPYKCLDTTCAKLQGFTYSGGLLRHEREVHGKHGGPKASIMCPVPDCKRHSRSGFTRQENLDEHMRRAHQINVEAPQSAATMHSVASQELEDTHALLTTLPALNDPDLSDVNELLKKWTSVEV